MRVSSKLWIPKAFTEYPDAYTWKLVERSRGQQVSVHVNLWFTCSLSKPSGMHQRLDMVFSESSVDLFQALFTPLDEDSSSLQ